MPRTKLVDTSHHRDDNQNPTVADPAYSKKAALPGGRLKGRDGDRINAVLAAVGYNSGLLLRWLKRLLRAVVRALRPVFGGVE